MDSISLAQQFIRIDSVTSRSNRNIADVQRQFLEELGFEVQELVHRDFHGVEKVALAARRLPQLSAAATMSSGLAFACHNDVVSVDGWDCVKAGPFDANVSEGRLWGRGACDMKGPTAGVLASIANLLQDEQLTAPIYIFITGDEEAGMAGARLLRENSPFFHEVVSKRTPMIIPEPTELNVVNAHKGGCHFNVTSSGVTAHSSTSDGLNANWQLIPFLHYLRAVVHRCETSPELRNSDFTPSTLSLNIVVQNEPAAFNITVGRASCQVFFRPMPKTAWRELLEEIKHTACDMELELSSIRLLNPVLTPVEHPFVQTTLRLLDQPEPRTACYATDGCSFENQVDLLVLGPGSIEQAHRHDEWIDLDQLKLAQEVYSKLLRHYAFAPIA